MRQKRASASGDGDGGTTAGLADEMTANERARRPAPARRRRRAGDDDALPARGRGEDGGSGNAAGGVPEGDGDEAASEGGGTSFNSVKTGRPDGSSPGATPEPLGESNAAGWPGSRVRDVGHIGCDRLAPRARPCA